LFVGPAIMAAVIAIWREGAKPDARTSA